MNRTKLMIAAVIVLVTAYAASLYAQSTNIEIRVPTTTSITGTVKVAIPFQFSVAGKTFPAGTYYIGPSGEKAMAIRSVAGPSLMVLTNAVTANNVTAPKLVFHKYGHEYFLAQAWLRNSDSGRELFVSPREIQMAREYRQAQVALQGK
jgi:hypothetical protein